MPRDDRLSPGAQVNLPVVLLMFSSLGALLAAVTLLSGASIGGAALAYLLPVGLGLGFALRAGARGRRKGQAGLRTSVNKERFRK